MTRLTVKQEKFCQKYVETGNASEAYRQSYDCENSNESTICNEAYLLLQNPDITLRVEELTDLALKRHSITVDKIVVEYAKIAFLDINQIFYPDGTMRPVNEIEPDARAAIAGIEIEEIYDGRGEGRSVIGQLKKVKISDKKGALDSLGKYLGMFIDKSELSGPKGGPIELSDAKSTLLRGLVPNASSPGTDQAN
jgi:phage terminase small subunit